MSVHEFEDLSLALIRNSRGAVFKSGDIDSGIWKMLTPVNSRGLVNWNSTKPEAPSIGQQSPGFSTVFKSSSAFFTAPLSAPTKLLPRELNQFPSPYVGEEERTLKIQSPDPLDSNGCSSIISIDWYVSTREISFSIRVTRLFKSSCVDITLDILLSILAPILLKDFCNEFSVLS